MLILNFSTMTAVFTWMYRVEQVCLITSNIVQKTKPNQIVLLQVKRVHFVLWNFRQLWTCLKIHPLKRAESYSPGFKGSGR